MDEKKISGVLDWGDAYLGEPERDVAYTIVVLASWGHLDSSESISRWETKTYLNHYRSLRGLDMKKIDYYKAVNCISYLEWVSFGGTEVIPISVINRLVDVFKDITGIVISPDARAG